MQIRSDCVHFKGETPCAFKRLCEGCPEFTPFGTKILLIKRAAMGDVLRTTALLPGLKRKYPESSVFWVVDPESEDLLRHNPFVDRVFPFNPESLLALAAARFDVLICLDKDPGATALATLLPCERKSGFGMNEHGIPRPVQRGRGIRLPAGGRRRPEVPPERTDLPGDQRRSGRDPVRERSLRLRPVRSGPSRRPRVHAPAEDRTRAAGGRAQHGRGVEVRDQAMAARPITGA